MKVLLSIITLVVLMSVSAGISAQGGYFGASIGQVTFKALEPIIDDTDMGWRLFGGYRINRFFAIEGAWTDFGEPNNDSLGYNVSMDTDAFSVTGLGIIPVHDKFELFGMIGLSAWKARLKFEGHEIDSEDNIDPTYGIGAAFNVNQAFTIRGDWQAYDMSELDEASLLSLSFVYNM